MLCERPPAAFGGFPLTRGRICNLPLVRGSASEASERARGSLTQHLEIGVEQHAPSAVATICRRCAAKASFVHRCNLTQEVEKPRVRRLLRLVFDRSVPVLCL